MAIDWGTLRRLADGQCQLLTRRQCLAAGMSAETVDWRISSKRWIRVHDGVYLTKPGRNDWNTTALAALLSASSGSVAADAAFRGRSAAFLWGLERTPPTTLEIVVPQRRSVRMSAPVQVKRSMRWDDLVDDLAFPWRTTLAVTVLDLASKGSPVDALSVVAKAVQKKLVTPSQLRQEIVARGGHKHSRLLRPALVEVADGAESGAELLYIRDVEKAHGLPTARRQAGSELGAQRRHDNEYEGLGLVVEVDGQLGHEEWSDRVRDGQRDRQLLTARRVTTRVFWIDVAVLPCRTAAEIAAILRTRGWGGTLRRCRRTRCDALAPSV